MKSWLNAGAFLSLSIAFTVNAEISVTDTSVTSFDIGGEIQPECKVANQSSSQATQLNLRSQEAQAAANVSVWCNTGQDTADATYSSANEGYLVNEEGNRIAYSIGLENNNSNFNLVSPQTIRQNVGNGENGQNTTSQLSILPQVTGFESAGAYRDTIQVTVSYN